MPSAQKNPQGPPQPAIYRLQHLCLDSLTIKAIDVRLLLESLNETNVETLLELSLTNFNLNDDKAVAHLGQLVRSQTNLAILNLSYSKLRAA